MNTSVGERLDQYDAIIQAFLDHATLADYYEAIEIANMLNALNNGHTYVVNTFAGDYNSYTVQVQHKHPCSKPNCMHPAVWNVRVYHTIEVAIGTLYCHNHLVELIALTKLDQIHEIVLERLQQ